MLAWSGWVVGMDEEGVGGHADRSGGGVIGRGSGVEGEDERGEGRGDGCEVARWSSGWDVDRQSGGGW